MTLTPAFLLAIIAFDLITFALIVHVFLKSR
jgi:hypothetical protein